MTSKEIANKYVLGNHDALTDNQEKLDMVADIEEYAKQKDERIKELEEAIDYVLNNFELPTAAHVKLEQI